MRTRKREQMITVREVEIDGHWFNADELFYLLEELEETDTFMSRILINNADLAKVLEARQVIWQSAKHSYARYTNYESFTAEFNELYFKIDSNAT